MLKKMKEMFKNERGLTLIELLAVIVILAIIAAIAVPAIGDVIAKTEDRAKLAEASNILSAGKLAAVNGDCTSSGTKITCNHENLNPYLEGVTLGKDEQAVKTNDAWVVTYKKLNGWKSKKYRNHFETNTITNTTISEAELNVALAQ